jgi:hypothetical protein
MSSNNNFINFILDESYQKYIKPATELDGNFYRVFDNNCEDGRVIINGKIDKIVNLPKNLNAILNLDISCGNIVHVPMVSDIFIEYESIKELIHIKDLNINSFFYVLNNNEIKILSPKNNKNILFQDIIIETHKGELIIIQIYKFKIPIENITHGAVIIYQDDFDNSNQNNTIYYTKNNDNLLLNSINDNSKIKDDNKKNKKIKPTNIREFTTL